MTTLAPSMRTFQLRGPFGLRMTFKTKVPGTLWFQYPRAGRGHLFATKKSATELTTHNPLEDFEQIYIDIPMGTDALLPQESLNAARRTPSPAPTEVVPAELTQEEIVEDIQKLGIKVRDFAYEDLPPGLEPVPEIFDQDKALGDYDYKLSMKPRQSAVPGKTLRRLIDLKWITSTEARNKWHSMDWASLKEYDKRPRYPWKARKIPFPSDEEREASRKHWTYYNVMVTRALIEEQADNLMEHLSCDTDPQPSGRSDSPDRGEKRYHGDDGRNDEGRGGHGRDSSPPDTKRRKVGERINGTFGPVAEPSTSISATTSALTSAPPNPAAGRSNGLRRTRTFDQL